MRPVIYALFARTVLFFSFCFVIRVTIRIHQNIRAERCKVQKYICSQFRLCSVRDLFSSEYFDVSRIFHIREYSMFYVHVRRASTERRAANSIKFL